MPAEFVRFGQTWETYHPDWEIKLWTEDNLFPLINHPAFDACNSFSEQSDFIRWELMLRYGGIYLDTDFECLKNIESLLEGVDAFAASEGVKEAGDMISVGIFGMTAGHPIAQLIVDRIAGPPFPRSSCASTNSGPIFVTRLLERHPLKSRLKIFPPELFYPWPWERPVLSGPPAEIFPDAFAVHHWAGSWMSGQKQTPTISGGRLNGQTSSGKRLRRPVRYARTCNQGSNGAKD